MSTQLATLELLSARSSVEPVGTLALPVRDHVNAATMMSLLHTDWSFLGERAIDRIVLQGSILTLQRNEAVQKMRGDFLLFIDDDMVWSPDAVGKLLASYQEIAPQFDVPVMLGGLCFRRTPPYQPTLYMRETPTSGPYNFLEKWDEGVVEVDATGCAFLIIPTGVFEAIAESPMPSYEDRQQRGGLPSFFRWEKQFGEDLRFCQDAKAAGVRIFVDTRIEIGHVTELTIKTEHYLQQIATRDPVMYASRLMVNNRMGLPTMKAEEARERLGW